MSNAVEIANPAKAFRAIAADRLKTAADMTLHQLVDEFQRLTSVMEQNVAPDTSTSADEWDGGPSLNEVGQVAQRERGIVDGAARARFGISFSAYDSTF